MRAVAIFRAISLIHVNGMLLRSFTVLTREKSLLRANRGDGRTRASVLNNSIANTLLRMNIYITHLHFMGIRARSYRPLRIFRLGERSRVCTYAKTPLSSRSSAVVLIAFTVAHVRKR